MEVIFALCLIVIFPGIAVIILEDIYGTCNPKEVLMIVRCKSCHDCLHCIYEDGWVCNICESVDFDRVYGKRSYGFMRCGAAYGSRMCKFEPREVK